MNAEGTGASVTCSVIPMLSVRTGARAIEFYKSAFGAIEVYQSLGGNSKASCGSWKGRDAQA